MRFALPLPDRPRPPRRASRSTAPGGAATSALVRFRNPALAPAERAARAARRSRSTSRPRPTRPQLSRRRSPAAASRRCTLALRARRRRARIVHPDEPRARCARSLDAHPRARPRRAASAGTSSTSTCASCARAARRCGLRAEPRARRRATSASRRTSGFTRQARAELPGRMVLDGIALVRDALRLDDYRLETVARARARPRQADRPGRARRRARRSRACGARIRRRSSPTTSRTRGSCSRSSSARVCSRSPSSAACSPACSSTASARASPRFDLLYLPELRRRGCVGAERRPRERERRARAGRRAARAACPGFHRDVAVFDFKSLYPSLIRTFQLDPLAHARGRRRTRSSRRTARASRARARSCPA